MRNKLLLAFGGTLALAALALPATSSAAACPPGQAGNSPYCTDISNKFSLGKVKHPKTGVILIRVRVSNGGTFTASGRLMRTARAEGEAAGTFTLRLTLSRRGMRKLRDAKGRHLRIRVKFTFTPTGGLPRTKYKKLIFRVVNEKKQKKSK